MKVSCITNGLSFKRNLTPDELKDYSKVLSECKKIVGQTGKSIFIMSSACLPQTKDFNSGIGHLSSDISQEYLLYMKNYLGINAVEDLPPGQIKPSKFYCAYSSSGLALGNHMINPELLATKEYEYLLSKKDLKKIHLANNSPEKNNFANFKNVMDNTGEHNKALKKAFKKFKTLKSNNPLVLRYEKFIKDNDAWLNFKREGEDVQEFFKFKQFLAEEHHKIGKNKTNKNGLKLIGDCLIGFSDDEVNAFPKAFKKGYTIGWNLPALNYDEILDDSSDAAKLLKMKIQLFAKRYDCIRFDVGWAYVTPGIFKKGDNIKHKKYMGSALLEKIEKWVKEIKGENFDLKNLIYEFDASSDDFAAFEKNGKLIPPLRNRIKIYGSTYMHHYPNDEWGYNKAFLNRGWSPDEYVLGVGNHDPQPLRQIANNVPDIVLQKKDGNIIKVPTYHKDDAIKPLSEIFNISPEKLQNPVEFAKYKWAEPMMAKNNMMFYMDVFGKADRFDKQWQNHIVTPEQNFAYKVPCDFKRAYQKSIQEGFGFNPMDAYEKIFKARGLDKIHSELFKKIIILKNKLLEPKEIVSFQKNKFTNILLLSGVLISSVVATVILINHRNKKSNDNNNFAKLQKETRSDVVRNTNFYSFNDFINLTNTK